MRMPLTRLMVYHDQLSLGLYSCCVQQLWCHSLADHLCDQLRPILGHVHALDQADGQRISLGLCAGLQRGV